MRHYFVILFAVILLTIPWFAVNFPFDSNLIWSNLEKGISQLASVVLSHNPKSVADIQSRYNTNQISSTKQKVRILLVPGHEPEYGGAEYGKLKERNMNVELAQDLQEFLNENGKYQVFITRDSNSWNPIFADYFKNNWSDIIAWYKLHKDEIVSLTELGQFRRSSPTVLHVNAPENVAIRLLGIDKWVNDNDIDIAIHIHFNDYPRKNLSSPGKYSGFAIYVPEKQYSNSSTTKALAESIFRRMEKYNPVSNLPGENNGIVEDQDLLAVGSNNTVNAASLLMEYGYIYEPQFNDMNLESVAIKDLAFQTYLGIQDFLDPNNTLSLSGSFDTLILPHVLSGNVIAKSDSSSEVFALQTELLFDGEYPPLNNSKNDCPRTGTFGACTISAISEFQKKYGIVDEAGIAGKKTIEKLNELYAK